MGSLCKLGLSAVGIGIAALKVHTLPLTRLTPLDQRIQKLIQEQGLFFNYPSIDFEFTSASISFGKYCPAYPTRTGQFEINIEWEGNRVFRTIKRDYFFGISADFDPDTKNAICNFCIESLEARRTRSLVARIFNIEPASYQIITQSALAELAPFSRSEMDRADLTTNHELLEAKRKREGKTVFDFYPRPVTMTEGTY